MPTAVRKRSPATAIRRSCATTRSKKRSSGSRSDLANDVRPPVVVRPRHVREIERDPVEKAFVLRLEQVADAVTAPDDGKLREHLIADQGAHVAPPSFARKLVALRADVAPTVGFDHR